jgi:hypothetical protein
MSQVSKKRLATRLVVRPSHTVHLINPPAQYKDVLGQLPSGARLVDHTELPADRVQVFASSKAELRRLLPAAMIATKLGGALWVSYPKTASGLSDLSRQVVHDELRLAGWKPVAQIAVDEVWSAIRSRPATEEERDKI